MCENRTRLLHGDCLEVLCEMEEASVHAVVTDPPYGLSTRPPDIREVMERWVDGDGYEHGSSGFAGEDWDSFVPGPRYWREALRVLKPGGHLLVFAHARTADLMATALRFAGAEIRDTLHWTYGEGMPTSGTLDKYIDKAAGTADDRQVTGMKSTNVGLQGGNYACGGSETGEVPVTRAASAEATKWEGWHAQLKAAHEPVIVARKPLERISSDQLHRATGWDHWCHSQRCRSGKRFEHFVNDLSLSPLEEDGERYFVYESRKALHDGTESVKLVRHAEGEKELERESYRTFYNDSLTANLLVHETGALAIPACRVSSDDRDEGRWPSNVLFSHAPECRLADEAAREGLDCARHCPVRDLERQHDNAARFFETFRPTVYCPKPSRSERNRGLGAAAKASGGDSQPCENTHKTVKPADLMRYLCRLVTKPGGRILDPFMGSGTTGMAAVSEDFAFTGIEIDEEYYEIARERISDAVRRNTAGGREEDGRRPNPAPAQVAA